LYCSISLAFMWLTTELLKHLGISSDLKKSNFRRLGKLMNKFTLLIHNKGWKVQDACDYWCIHYDTYNKRCNSAKFHNQLECMCKGLEDKLND